MSKPRYDWCPYVKGMIRRYPVLKAQYADLHSTSMTEDYSGMPRGGGGGRAFSADELATMRVLYAEGARYVAQDAVTIHWFTKRPQWIDDLNVHRIPTGVAYQCCILPDGIFHSIRPGQSVDIEDIINGK